MNIENLIAGKEAMTGHNSGFVSVGGSDKGFNNAVVQMGRACSCKAAAEMPTVTQAQGVLGRG